MDEFPAHIDESALDLSIFADYPTSLSAISQNSSSILIELPVGTISTPGSDKVLFYLEPSGQLVLANFIYERINESIVLKHVAVPPTSNPQGIEEVQDSSTVEPSEFPDPPNSVESNNAGCDVEDDQKLLKQKVKNILSMPLSIPGADGNAIVGGYNISKLVQTAERLKNYRIRRNLSQAKLSELICRNTVGELKFSQTFLCRCGRGNPIIDSSLHVDEAYKCTDNVRLGFLTPPHALRLADEYHGRLCYLFENLEVTLRVALRANPYLEKWLDRVENQEEVQEEEEALDRVQDSVSIGNFLISRHPASSPPMETTIVDETTTTDGLMAELLDLRERISPPTNGNKECSCGNYGDVEEEEANECESVQLPKRRNRKERVYFTEAAVAQMMEHYDLNPWPRGQELTDLAESLGYGRESVRLWFVNRRYQLKLASKQ